MILSIITDCFAGERKYWGDQWRRDENKTFYHNWLLLHPSRCSPRYFFSEKEFLGYWVLRLFISLSLAMSIIFVKILLMWNKNLIRFLNKCKRYSKVYKNKCNCDIKLYLLNFLQFFIQKLTQLFLLNQILGWC